MCDYISHVFQVSFKPDLAKFKMTHLDADTVALMTRRAYDIAGCTKGVTVSLNGTKLPVSTDCICVHLHHLTVYLGSVPVGYSILLLTCMYMYNVCATMLYVLHVYDIP